MPTNDGRRTDAELRAEAESIVGRIVAGMSSVDDLEPVALQARLENELDCSVDARGLQALAYMNEGEPKRLGRDLDLEILQKVVLDALREKDRPADEAVPADAPVQPVEQVDEHQAVVDAGVEHLIDTALADKEDTGGASLGHEAKAERGKALGLDDNRGRGRAVGHEPKSNRRNTSTR
jgi:hypothetical protein